MDLQSLERQLSQLMTHLTDKEQSCKWTHGLIMIYHHVMSETQVLQLCNIWVVLTQLMLTHMPQWEETLKDQLNIFLIMMMTGKEFTETVKMLPMILTHSVVMKIKDKIGWVWHLKKNQDKVYYTESLTGSQSNKLQNQLMMILLLVKQAQMLL